MPADIYGDAPDWMQALAALAPMRQAGGGFAQSSPTPQGQSILAYLQAMLGVRPGGAAPPGWQAPAAPAAPPVATPGDPRAYDATVSRMMGPLSPAAPPRPPVTATGGAVGTGSTSNPRWEMIDAPNTFGGRYGPRQMGALRFGSWGEPGSQTAVPGPLAALARRLLPTG